jgi:ligand-binding sensor domain-containing protein/signal transduction histidine kinase
LFTLLLSCLGTLPAFALDPSKSIFQYNCRNWTRQNGLPANGVQAIAQTKDGYLWLGTAIGLVRFDGVDFQPIDMDHVPLLLSPDVSCLSVSKKGGLWLGLAHGAFAYCDGESVSPRGKDEWGGTGTTVQSILESSNGDLWLATQVQAARVTATGAFESVLPSDSTDVVEAYEDSHGRVWLGTTRRGLYYWKDGIVTKFPDPALDGTIVRAVVEDREGNLWFGTQAGVAVYDAKFQKLPVSVTSTETRALLVDRAGAVWIGTMSGGLIRYWNGVAMEMQKSDGLADDFVNSLAEDQEGSLWVGTRNGLSQLSDVKLPIYSKTEGLTPTIAVSVRASRQGGLWVAGENGLTHFDGSTNARTYGAEAGLGNTYLLYALEAKNGDIYVVNGAMEVLIFSGGKIVARYPNINYPTALVEDDEGVVVAVADKLYRVGANYYSPFLLADGQPAEVPGYVFNLAAGHDGSIWVATANAILQVKSGAIKRWPEQGNTTVLWIWEDPEGVVWAGTRAGIARLKGGQLQYITQDDGLFNNSINALVLDDHDWFWADSDRGFFSVSRSSLNDFADGKIKHVSCKAYDSLSNVKTVERNQQKPSGCKTLDGRIWFPKAQGLVMIDPNHLAANLVPPQIHVDVARANGQDLTKSGRAVARPGKGELEFHYVGLSFVAPEKIQYRIKLDGYDKQWLTVGTRRSAFYTNLKPGQYDFHVQACNEDGIWSNADTHFAVMLQPHYYQTGWFYLAIGLLAAGALAGAYRWRVKHLQLRQKRLQETNDLLEVKVGKRTAELAREIDRRQRAQVEIEAQKVSLEKEIEERKRMERVIERTHQELMIASRHAGQAEVATNVLHNVGNVLNSVNVSANVLSDRLRRPYADNLAKAVGLVREHQADLARFLTEDRRGQALLPYLEQLASQLDRERNELLSEVNSLGDNVHHITEIVATQQSIATTSVVMEQISLAETVECALKMQLSSFDRHSIALEREFEDLPPIVADRHKLLQILVNLLSNAKNACEEAARSDKKIVVRIKALGRDQVAVAIEDNGIGIPPGNLTRIFAHGFTTRTSGHGFGLHSSALAAKEMNGSLTAHSEGLGQGAVFTLELPCEVGFRHAGHAEPVMV